MVIDVSEPTAPFEVAEIDMPNFTWKITVSGELVFAASHYDGIRVIDISDPINPLEIGYYDTPGYALDIDTLGDDIYVTDYFYFGIYEFTGGTSVEKHPQSELPQSITLAPIRPNPFNASADIIFRIAEPGRVKLTVYNLQGRELSVLANGYYSAGTYSINWSATDVASGVYFISLRQKGNISLQKVLLVR